MFPWVIAKCFCFDCDSSMNLSDRGWVALRFGTLILAQKYQYLAHTQR